MSAFKRFIRSRKTVMALVVIILATTVIGFFFPQRFMTPPDLMEKWAAAHPYLNVAVVYLGLDHVYTTPWFSIALSLFLLSLALSSYDQMRLALKRTFNASGVSGGKTVELELGNEADLAAALRRNGYLRIAANQSEQRFMKHPWGHWGKFLLHLGMAAVIAASLLILLSQKRGLLELYEGESYFPGGSWSSEERGFLAGRFILPMSVRLKSVRPEFWETDDLKHLASTLEFTASDGSVDTRRLGVNETLRIGGIKIYQSHRFGTAFFVEVFNEKGERRGEILQLTSPLNRDKAAYGNFRFSWMPYLLKAKYFADAEKIGMESVNPLLVLRLVDDNRAVGELSLKTGEDGLLGRYKVRLVEVKKWAGIIFTDVTGMPGIFFGFFIIILGGGLAYFTPPREVVLRRTARKLFLSWKAARFEEFYQEEFEALMNLLNQREGRARREDDIHE